MEENMRIKDIEINFSFTDADDIERFENEARKVEEKAKNYEKKEMSTSEAIREECNVIEEFFDNVFEKGISQKLFKGKKDIADHINLFQDIVNAKLEQTKGLQNIYDNLDRYIPNRETRRYNNRKGRR